MARAEHPRTRDTHPRVSAESVEKVRKTFEAWNRGDRDGWLAFTHADAEFSSATARHVEGRDAVYRGRAGLERFWDESHRVWDLGMEIMDLRDLGDTVLAIVAFRATGKASGVSLQQTRGYVFEFEDGLGRRMTSYQSADEALAAVGLTE
jgi:ketosteroid isomerase-like protein